MKLDPNGLSLAADAFLAANGVNKTVGYKELSAAITAYLVHLAQDGQEPEAAYIRTGVYDRDGREILVGDTIRINLASQYTREEYWQPEYRVAFKAPSFVLEHIGGGKDSDTARWYFRVPQKSSTEKIETLSIAPSAPAGGSDA